MQKRRAMIQETVSKIEERLRSAPVLREESKAELLNLLATLKTEVERLSATHDEEVESITSFTHISTHEATREEKNPKLLQLSLEGLATSVDGFRNSHPKLVQLVNRICTTLSNLGV
jgi:hypothetical protein